jgi:CRISPR/Cas system-associated endoribonuclease Cas2
MRRRTASYCAFAKYWPSNRQLRVAGPNTPALSDIAGQCVIYMVLDDLSRVGCGARLPRIAYSQKWALEPTNASRRAKGTRLKYSHRTVWSLLGAWRNEPSAGLPRLAHSQKWPSNRRVRPRALQYRRGSFIHRDRIRLIHVCEREWRRIRRYGALHCAFAKQGPQIDELTTAPRRFPLLTRSPPIVVCIWYVEVRAERDAAEYCLTLRIRKIGPSDQRVRLRVPQYRCGSFVHRDRIRLIDVCEREWRRIRWYGALHCAFAK